MLISGPFYNMTTAARFCGYSLRTFQRKLKDYDLPRHGPSSNRFAKSVLDAWMENPPIFEKCISTRRRKPNKVLV